MFTALKRRAAEAGRREPDRLIERSPGGFMLTEFKAGDGWAYEVRSPSGRLLALLTDRLLAAVVMEYIDAQDGE